jgi:hypothetical protein
MSWADDNGIDAGYDLCLCEDEAYGNGALWQDHYGNSHQISKMETRYLRNCIAYLNRRAEDDSLSTCCLAYIYDRIADLENELIRRKYRSEALAS